ncbi:protein TolQ [Abditibacteriota bacterium]|nr:protein TolQ [Abditibacteriota bacterium]
MTEWLTAHGGLVGLGVLAAKYILLAFSVVSVAVVGERVWMLRRVRLAETRDYTLVRAALGKQDEAKLRALAEQSGAPCAAVLGVGLEHLTSSEARLREATQSEVSAQIAALQHNLPILATTASTAPYVGLFGTVLGILAAFRDIAQTGQTGASVIAGGISEALTSTALGLGVAIPAVMAYNYFSARINRLSSVIETHALDVTEQVVGLAPKGTPTSTTEGEAIATE